VRFTLLSRAYCHLCDEMQQALAAMAPTAPVDVIDVDAPEHAAVESRWGDAVPVLFAGLPARENELCRFRLEPEKVAAVLAARGEIR